MSPTSSPLFIAVQANDVQAAADALRDPDLGLEAACALRVLEQRGHLEDVCAVLVNTADGPATLDRLERLTLENGLVSEQHCITAARERCTPTEPSAHKDYV